MSSVSDSPSIDHKSLRSIPGDQKNLISSILDLNNSWIDLAKEMGFEEKAIVELKNKAVSQRSSPSDLLITLWSTYGHNVTELFVLLSRLQQYPAMESIKSLVDHRYHKMIKFIRPDLSRLLEASSGGSEGVLSATKKLLNRTLDVNNESKIFKIQPIIPTNTPAKDTRANINSSFLNIPHIPYIELEKATGNFSKDKILGSGGFGTVYEGLWINTRVAIKRLECRAVSGTPKTDYDKQKEQIYQSLNELRHLNCCRHDNILAIYGYSMIGDQYLMVYQYMPGGSLEERLLIKNDTTVLTWPERYKIILGTARGLQYLHRYKDKPLIHGDIKPANILLDICLEPKIGDFGLSREGVHDEATEVSRIFGTKPYLPREFLDDHLFSTKVDIFSFGVVLFEVATGLRAKLRDRHPTLLYEYMYQVTATLEELIDKSTPNDDACMILCDLMIELGKRCTNKNMNFRPSSVEVLLALEEFLTVIKPKVTVN